MRIKKPLAIIIGLVTVWPLFYFGLFLVFFVYMALTIFQHAPHHQPDPQLFSYIVIPHVGTMLISIALAVFYIVHVFKNAALKDDRRVLWAVVLFMGLPFSAPVYWWLFIWRPTRHNASV
jgi:hypothetical protein